MGQRFIKSFKWCKINAIWEWVPSALMLLWGATSQRQARITGQQHDYRISSNRSPRPLLAQLCQTPGLYSRSGLYSRPGFYSRKYGSLLVHGRIDNYTVAAEKRRHVFFTQRSCLNSSHSSKIQRTFRLIYTVALTSTASHSCVLKIENIHVLLRRLWKTGVCDVAVDSW